MPPERYWGFSFSVKILLLLFTKEFQNSVSSLFNFYETSVSSSHNEAEVVVLHRLKSDS